MGKRYMALAILLLLVCLSVILITLFKDNSEIQNSAAKSINNNKKDAANIHVISPSLVDVTRIQKKSSAIVNPIHRKPASKKHFAINNHIILEDKFQGKTTTKEIKEKVENESKKLRNTLMSYADQEPIKINKGKIEYVVAAAN